MVRDAGTSTAEFRGSVVKGEAPRALLLIAAVVAVLSVYNALLAGQPAWTDILHLVVVAVLLVGAWFAAWPHTSVVAMPWIVAGCLTLVVLSVEVQAWEAPTAVGLAYVLVGIVGYAPFVLSPVAAGLAAVPMVIGYVAVTIARFPDDVALWLGVGLAAALVGGLLLWVRLAGIDALGALTERSREIATRDPLTGLLNRRGLLDRVDSVTASAQRHEEPVFVVFIDVNGLKRVNDEHGHEWGDQVIRAAANALRGVVRASDFVGRWGGDEFVILGAGTPMPCEALEARLSEHLDGSGVPADVWSGGLSLGLESAGPVDLDFDALVRSADRDMYDRRRSVRGI